jgi:hypothetical protein
MKAFFLIATLLLSLSAQANDGFFAYVDVLGVNPKNILPLAAQEKSVQVYGGDTAELAALLPYNSIHEASYMNFVSKGWNVSIACPKYYYRPTNGEYRSDFMCEFSINRFSVQELMEIKGDSDYTQYYDLPTGNSLSGNYTALGINPNGVQKGTLFDIYGDDAYVLNEMINGSTLRFSSKAYTLKLSCQKEYQRPAGNMEFRDDYMCTLSLQ